MIAPHVSEFEVAAVMVTVVLDTVQLDTPPVSVVL